jgi:hypothetical protein
MPNVARATDGAAPKSPAKLLAQDVTEQRECRNSDATDQEADDIFHQDPIRSPRGTVSRLIHAFEVISFGENLTAFLVGDRHVCHKTLNEGSFPDFLFAVTWISDLLVSFEQRVHRNLQQSGNPRAVGMLLLSNRAGKGSSRRCLAA